MTKMGGGAQSIWGTRAPILLKLTHVIEYLCGIVAQKQWPRGVECLQQQQQQQHWLRRLTREELFTDDNSIISKHGAAYCSEGVNHRVRRCR